MRIALVYPPYRKGNKTAFLPQNRQFVYSASRQVRLYPVVMATAATMLRQAGHSVFWLDGITEGLRMNEFYRRLRWFRPEIVVTETKAPVMEKVWQFINKLKSKDKSLTTILVGDHVTYFPEESFKKSKVDYVLTGGDYDFLLVSLMEHLGKGNKLEAGIWYRSEVKRKKEKGKTTVKNSKIFNTGNFQFNHDLDQTPIIDRNLTRSWLYGEADVLNPCEYMMFGRGCGGVEGRPGSCTFCIWQHCLWKLKPRLRSPEHVVGEIKFILNQSPVREIFDDTDGGAHYDYQWLKRFFRLLKKEKILGQVSFATNSRADVLDKKACRLLKECGFRMLKVGIESGSPQTLGKIAKGETVAALKEGVKNAKDAGLIVHLSAMVGYPWEMKEDVKKTYQLMKELLLYKTRVGDSVQASVVVPYPGTPLWQEAKQKNWLTVKANDYEKYDMSRSVLKNQVNTSDWCRRVWNLHLHPLFLIKTIFSIRSYYDLAFLYRGALSHFGHTQDY